MCSILHDKHDDPQLVGLMLADCLQCFCDDCSPSQPVKVVAGRQQIVLESMHLPGHIVMHDSQVCTSCFNSCCGIHLPEHSIVPLCACLNYVRANHVHVAVDRWPIDAYKRDYITLYNSYSNITFRLWTCVQSPLSVTPYLYSYMSHHGGS